MLDGCEESAIWTPTPKGSLPQKPTALLEALGAFWKLFQLTCLHVLSSQPGLEARRWPSGASGQLSAFLVSWLNLQAPKFNKALSPKRSGKAVCGRQRGDGFRGPAAPPAEPQRRPAEPLPAVIPQGLLQQVATSRESIGTFWPRTGSSLERSNPEAGGHGSRGHRVGTRHGDR